MNLLRRTLSIGAFVLLVTSLALLIAPGWLTGILLGQSPTQDVWLRLLGATSLSLALIHVLIARKIEELWWWSWAIVAFDAITAIVTILHALVGLPEGSPAWPWWVTGSVSTLFAALYLAGLARAGQEKPFA